MTASCSGVPIGEQMESTVSMSPRRLPRVPALTARVATAAFARPTLAMRIRDELGELFSDERFAAAFATRGRPGLSPGQLALVTVLQFAAGLTDRHAAEAVRARIDWKYCLGLELDDPGFDFSVLSELRSRSLGLAPWLSWSFTFPFAEVTREYGSSPVSLNIEWVRLDAPGWRRMAGVAGSSPRFGEPAEASVYFFEHHRYESVDVQVLEQDGPAIEVAATVQGDLDGLGVERVTARGWLDFAGIYVSRSLARTPAEASARLHEFVEVEGLSYAPGAPSAAWLFGPGGRRPQPEP